MQSKAIAIQKQWERKRSRLYDLVDAKKSPNNVEKIILDVMTACPLNSDCVRKKKSNPSHAHDHISVSGVDRLGLNKSDITTLLSSLPGHSISGLDYQNQPTPHHCAQSTSNNAVVIFDSADKGLVMKIYDPMKCAQHSSDILCHGCLHVYSLNAPIELSSSLNKTIAKAVDGINSHEFHSTHKDKITKPGRNQRQSHKDHQALLWSSLLQTAYEAPFFSDRQDWSCATQKALMGMQYIDESQAKYIVDALSQYFEELDPEADMNQLIRNYQKQSKVIEYKILSNYIADLFSVLNDNGLKRFFKHWVLTTDPNVFSLTSTSKHFPRHHTRSMCVGMALDDAKELGVNLTKTLRAGPTSITEKKRIQQDLYTSIRRFNDMWNELDKNEQRCLRPKLLQIIHSHAS